MRHQLKSSIKHLLEAQEVGGHDLCRQLSKAKGIVILTALKGAWLFSGALGQGVFFKRQGDGSWSNPAAVLLASAGVGIQMGLAKQSAVIILNSNRAVRNFEAAGQLRVEAEAGMAIGFFGAGGKLGVAGNYKSAATSGITTHQQGVFFGISADGSLIVSNPISNAKFYGKATSQKSIFSGKAQPKNARNMKELITVQHALDNLSKGRKAMHAVKLLTDKLENVDKTHGNKSSPLKAKPSSDSESPESSDEETPVSFMFNK